MSSDADKILARLEELEQNPMTNVGPGSEWAKLQTQLPYANIVDPADMSYSILQSQDNSEEAKP